MRLFRAQTPPYRPGRRCERGGPERRSKSNDQMREKVFITVFLPDASRPNGSSERRQGRETANDHLPASLI